MVNNAGVMLLGPAPGAATDEWDRMVALNVQALLHNLTKFGTPLTAGVLAAVSDADLGEALAVNDAASRVGGVVLVALVPALIGVGSSHGFGHTLATGYQPAMLVMAGLSVAAAVITGLFVSNQRAVAPQIPAAPRLHGCALPVPATVTDRPSP